MCLVRTYLIYEKHCSLYKGQDLISFSKESVGIDEKTQRVQAVIYAVDGGCSVLSALIAKRLKATQ